MATLTMRPTKRLKQSTIEALEEEHAEPVNGEVSWYKVMFEHGIETVEVNDPNVEIIEEGSHGSHSKKPVKKPAAGGKGGDGGKKPPAKKKARKLSQSND